jgi:ribosomal protein L37E
MKQDRDKMKCKKCGGTNWISYPVVDKQCKSCGHFQIEG